jgi:hypothetical protein
MFVGRSRIEVIPPVAYVSHTVLRAPYDDKRWDFNMTALTSQSFASSASPASTPRSCGSPSHTNNGVEAEGDTASVRTEQGLRPSIASAALRVSRPLDLAGEEKGQRALGSKSQTGVRVRPYLWLLSFLALSREAPTRWSRECF